MGDGTVYCYTSLASTMDDRGIFGGAEFDSDGSDEEGYGMTHDDVKFESSHRHTGPEASPGKIFVGGIAQVTTDAQFAVHFGKYGHITESFINKDLMGQHRGFGFVTYADPSVVDRVIKDTHIIDGKQVEVKRATVPRGARSEDFETKKIFVGGLPKDVSDEEFRDFFSKFGVVKQHHIARHRRSRRSRGFGFIVFESEQTAKDLLDNVNWCEFAGSMVEIRKPEPKKKTPPPPRPCTSASNPRAAFSGVGDTYSGYLGVPFYGRGLSSDSYRPGGVYGGGAGAIGFGAASYGGLRPNLLQGYSRPFWGGHGRCYNFGGAGASGGLGGSVSMPSVVGVGVLGGSGWGYNAGLSGRGNNSGWVAAPQYGNRERYAGVGGAVEVPLGGYVQVYDAGFSGSSSGSGTPLNASRGGDTIEVPHGYYGQGYDADFSGGNDSQSGGPLQGRRGCYGSAGKGRSHPYGPLS